MRQVIRQGDIVSVVPFGANSSGMLQTAVLPSHQPLVARTGVNLALSLAHHTAGPPFVGGHQVWSCDRRHHLPQHFQYHNSSIIHSFLEYPEEGAVHKPVGKPMVCHREPFDTADGHICTCNC
jgi:hypothetical protein